MTQKTLQAAMTPSTRLTSTHFARRVWNGTGRSSSIVALGTWLLLQTPAANAQGVPAEQEVPAAATSFQCDSGPWKFDGAQWESGSEVAYRDDWSSVLRNVAGCAPQVQRSGSCFEVQGHFDEIPFDATVVRAFGSKEAAQQARARGRANSILKKLSELGVPSTALREVSPGSRSTFRGAEVRVSEGCNADIGELEKRYESIVAAQMAKFKREQISPEEYAERTAIAMARMQPGTGPESLAAASTNHYWVGGGLDASTLFLFQNTDDVYAPVLSLAGGWHNEYLYGYSSLGASIGTEVEERIGLEAEIAGGYYRDKWIQGGISLGYRVASSGARTPWMDQAWFLAFEAQQCPWMLGKLEVCLKESLAPIGSHTRRAEYNDERDTIELIDQRRNNVIRLDVGVVARFEL